MHPTTVVVADAARARVFTYQPFVEPGNGAAPLIELAAFVDPARRLRPSELLSESRPASDRTPTGLGFTADDHREAYLEELDRRFAAEIIDFARESIEARHSDRLVVVASPNMLGHLRHFLDPLRRDIEVVESALDLTRETVPQLQAHLIKSGLVPAPPSPRP